jgi:cell division protease FtsH
LAARRNKRIVTMAEFEDAKDKIIMGAERRTMIMSEEEKLSTAYHEAGHAVVSVKVAGNDPLHKVTIIPRGQALGVTVSLPERDRLGYSKQWCDGKEPLNTGASSDIKMATSIAKGMVTEWGMSDKLGPLLYSEGQRDIFSGQAQIMGDDTARQINDEIRRFVTEGQAKAWEVLTAHRAELESVTRALMEYETITGEEVRNLLNGIPISRIDPDDSKGPTGSAVPTAGPTRSPREETGGGGLEPQPQT